MKTIKRSLIKKYFTDEIFLDIRSITMISNADNNIRGNMIKELLTEKGIPFSPLGSGTNRLGILIDGYAVKIALDKDGMIDNQREFLYAKQLYPYAVKVYECTNGGDIAVFEYVEIFTKIDIHTDEYVSKMEEMLSEITENYFVGDVGIAEKNYVNWGKRQDAEGSICMLDFAYIYNVKYKLMTCTKCGPEAVLKYDKKFVDLVCPYCGSKYTFGNIRRNITREEQKNEIGDIREHGYNLTEAEQEMELVPMFEPKANQPKKKKEKNQNSIKAIIKRHQKAVKNQASDEHDYWEEKQ